MAAQFFYELEKFLPKHVSVIPSYLHSGISFAIVLGVGLVFRAKYKNAYLDDIEGVDDKLNKKLKDFIHGGITIGVAILAADMVFKISWVLRNKVNRKHLVYRRWFPKLLGSLN